MNLWSMPGSYYGADWPNTYVFLSQNRDSDTLTRSNFTCALEQLKALPEFEEKGDELTSRMVVRESHWACGWIEWIAVHADDLEGVGLGERIETELDSYPVLNENHWSELEHEEAQDVWRDCYNNKQRVRYMREHRSQFECSDFVELMAVARGKYFNGYESELLT